METLNDLPKHRLNRDCSTFNVDTTIGEATDIVDKVTVEGVTISDLRQSAIEDIRKLRKEKRFILMAEVTNAYNAGIFYGKTDFIKEKFNITEEDLKESDEHE